MQVLAQGRVGTATSASEAGAGHAQELRLGHGGGDRSAVTGGTRVISDRIVIRITVLRRLCADLRQRLAECQSVQTRLAEALVQQQACA